MRSYVLMLAAVAALSGCASSSVPPEVTPLPAPAPSAPSAAPQVDPVPSPGTAPEEGAAPVEDLSVVLPPGVDPAAVVQAALAIASGTAEEAVAAGLLLPEEVEAAASALEEGVLDLYIAAAESASQGR